MEEQHPSSTSGEVIRITREEANSPEVEDLLRRQMSLRGETGVARNRRQWYYKNWFVFMIVGALGAFAAWAIIEPFFNDSLYLQGAIKEVNLEATMPQKLTDGSQYLELRIGGHGWITIGDDRVWLANNVRELRADGSKVPLDLEKLSGNPEVGVYAEYVSFADLSLGVARFIVLSPPPQRAGAASQSLSQLNARSNAAGMLLFPMVAGLVGLAIGAVDGLICRLPQRALLAGAVGLLVGFIGGFVSSILANLAYSPLNHLAMAQMDAETGALTTFAFLVQMSGRAMGWALAGMAMGLGQGIALRSGRLLLYGFIGGIVGGLLGGLVFDPLDILLLGTDKPSSHLSRMVGLALIGAAVGAMIGLVEILARDAWLRMTQGPLTGKEFLIFKDVMHIGSSRRSDLYLFNDPAVAPEHATLRAIGDQCEIEARSNASAVLVNDRPVAQARLRHGDRITIGRTAFIFQKRKT